MDKPTPHACKNWCFTINNPVESKEVYLKKLKDLIKYAILADEVGESGTPHIQGFAQFYDRIRLTALKKLFPTAHFEAMRGTPSQASEYCKKDGRFITDGVLAPTGPQARKRDYDAALNLAKEGKLEEIPANLRLPYYQTLKRIATDYMVLPPDSEDTTGIWLYGEPGVGKSKWARKFYQPFYDKPCNKWWDGYQNQPNVLIDDFDKVHHVLGHHLKRWTDRYSFPAEVKGGALQIRPECIVVTSNYTIYEIFDDPELVKALKRRFIEFHMK